MSFRRFIETRRTKSTSTGYSGALLSMLKDPDAFLDTATRDKRGAEDFLIDFVVSHREKLSGSTLTVWLSMAKSFLDFYEVSLNWKRIRSSAPAGSFVALDRAPLVEEIRKMLSYAPLRERVVSLVLASSGMRVGAFEGMKLSHVEELEGGLSKLRVYAGQREEYSTFISPEATAELKQYLEDRKARAHEVLSPNSPLIRNVWNYQNEAVKIVSPLSPETAKAELYRLWLKSGVKAKGQKQEFKQAHGFRKFFKTQLSRAGLSWEDQEVLLGHRLSYYRPTLDHLRDEYLKAVPFLTISEAEQAKTAMHDASEKHESELSKTRYELAVIRDEMRRNQEEHERQLKQIYERLGC
ncbi:MAG: site-specific integrase [Nitrososphaerota archaeon]|nr:site-specific integrase [Nitrososphaerota archaeon]